MSKKNFKALAEQLAAVRPMPTAEAYATWRECVVAVARACAEFNPAFSSPRFVAACHGE